MAVVDLLMSKDDVDLSVVDARGRTAMHHAASCTAYPMVAGLLTHMCATKCKVSKSLPPLE